MDFIYNNYLLCLAFFIFYLFIIIDVLTNFSLQHFTQLETNSTHSILFVFIRVSAS